MTTEKTHYIVTGEYTDENGNVRKYVRVTENPSNVERVVHAESDFYAADAYAEYYNSICEITVRV